RTFLANDHSIADANVRRLGATKTSRCNVREQNHLLVAQLIGNLCEIGLSIGREQIFRLRAVDGVTEPPAPDRLQTFAVTALRPLSRQTSPTLPAWGDRADKHAIADLVSG